jgi:FkbM family methyltransferase
MLSRFNNQVAAGLKQLLYGSRGEPYRVKGRTLRYLPGTRPVRLRYRSSRNDVVHYDALQLEWLSDHLSEGDTAIDIGAHTGGYSILMAASCGQSGHVVAFEPDPYARKLLMKNLNLDPSVKRPIVEALACSDEAGEATLYTRAGNSQSSLARSAVEFSTAHRSEAVRVPLVRLDDYLVEHKLPEPRWVKIDAEGAEIRILRGARDVLASKAGILCELHPYAWPELGNTLTELKDLVTASGRRIRYLDQNSEMRDSAEYGAVLLERVPRQHRD